MNVNKKSLLGGIALGVCITIVANFGLNAFNVVVSGSAGNIPNKTSVIRKVLDTYYMGEINDKALEEGMYKGMVQALEDPYTVYFDKDEYTDFMTDSDGEYAGIGVSVTPNKLDNTILVVTVFEGTPSFKAGILPGDKIIKVNGTDVTGDKMDEAVDVMRGEPGTTVDVTLYRESELKKIDLTLERKVVEVPTVAHRMLDNNIGYIELSQFDGVSYEQFKKAYDALNQAGQKGLILDLRYNPGGRLDIVEKIADLLVPEGPIVYIEYKGKGKEVDMKSDANAIKIPLVVLVNGYSASASEVLTGAIKDFKVGKVVGTTTFGKGIVQSLVPLPDGSGIKVTTAKYYTPSGVCIHGTGIEPDYVVELPAELQNKLVIDEAKDTQLQKAIAVVNEQIK